MAKVTWKSYETPDLYFVDLDWEFSDITRIDFSWIYHYHDYTIKSEAHQRLVDGRGGVWDLYGVGFTYNPFGSPSGGTITKLKYSWQGTTKLHISELSLSMAAVWEASKREHIQKDRQKDDRALIVSALSGNDTLKGWRGSETIKGYAGNDKIIGGFARDDLYGGSGADRFIFENWKDSTKKEIKIISGKIYHSGRDVIHDFSRREKDKIVLTKIDANTQKAGNQAFKWIGKKPFSGHAGELRIQKTGSETYVYGDVDGDGSADLAILVKVQSLQKGDFLL